MKTNVPLQIKISLTKRRVASLVLVAALLCSFFFAGYSYAQSGASVTISGSGISTTGTLSAANMTLSSGVFPSAASWTIYKDGVNYVAKAANGSIPSWGQSTNASYIILKIRDSLNPLVGGKLFFLLGKYDITTQMDFTGYRGVTFEMETRNWYNEVNVGFFVTANIASVFYVNNVASAGVYSLTFKNLKFWGNYPTWNTDGIVVRYSDRTVIDNCVFRYFRNSIDGGSMGDNCIINQVSAQYGDQGIILSGSLSFIMNAYIHNQTSYGIYLGGDSNTVRDTQIYYCAASASSVGLGMYQATNAHVDGGVYYSNARGIWIWREGSGNMIVNSRIYDNTYGIWIDGPAGTWEQNNTISNNIIYGNVHPLKIGGNGGSFKNILITGNILYGNTNPVESTTRIAGVFTNGTQITYSNMVNGASVGFLDIDNATDTTFTFNWVTLGLARIPNNVLVSFNTPAIHGWKWAESGGTVTITFEGDNDHNYLPGYPHAYIQVYCDPSGN
jgi:hypothetical protein